MKKQLLLSSLLIVMIIATKSNSQVSTLGHAGTPGNYLGWNNTNTFPLEIRHNGTQPINFFTNNVQRMRINSANLGNTLNGFTGQNTSGFVGISGDPTFWTAVTSPQTPVSLLHLIQ